MPFHFPKILVLATSRHTHGGISSVVKAHESTDEWNESGCKWIATHRSGSMAVKLLYMLTGLATYLVYLPMCKAVHIHIGEAPSARRKSIFMRLAKLFGKKTLVHFHAFDTQSTIDGPHRDLYRGLFASADRIIVLSRMWEKAVNSTFPFAEKIRILYNPCPAVPAAHGDIPRHKIILSAGVVSPRKGYDVLLKAFAKIAPMHPDWTLVFAGSGEIDKASALAADLGITSQVKFPGWVAGDAKDRLFREASLFCLPSYAEGFPMAVLDAWAYGLPVIATPVGGLPDIVTDNVDVLLFNPGDIDGLAGRLEQAVSDGSVRERLEKASHNFANNTFNINTIGQCLGNVYHDLIYH